MILMAHMAGLAKADEIFPGVSAFRAVEKPKWFNVVDRKALTDMFSAFGAIPALILHDSRASNKPTSPAIGSRSANPIRRIFTLRLRLARAFCGTKPRNAILTRQPRLLIEWRAAMFAGQRKPVLPTDIRATPYVFGSECVCWAFTGAKLVADKVGFGRSVEKRIGLPFGAARHAAKSRRFRPIGLNTKRGLADFTSFFNHAESIRQTGCMGKRTTLIACRRVEEAYRQPDLFVEQPAAPIQEGFDL